MNAQFLKFAQRDLIPVILETGTIDRYDLTRLLGVEDADGITYCLLLSFPSRPTFDIYRQKHLSNHQKMVDTIFKGHYVSFPSVLDVVVGGS